jgi:hypothetical protein
VPPQPSPTVPQNWLPALPQVAGTQPAFTHTLFVQVSPAAHVAQSRLCPQPSPIVPQKLVVPAVQVAAWQLEPPMQTLFVQLQSALQFMPQSMVPLQPSPMDPQYWPPIGVQETVVLQVDASGPPSGMMKLGPPPALLWPLLPEPAEPVAPPLLRIEPFATGPLEQLATAVTAATYSAPEKNHLSIAANARRLGIDHLMKHNCRTFHATIVAFFLCCHRASKPESGYPPRL